MSAIDWGRFLYIHLVSIFLLTFLAPANQSGGPNNAAHGNAPQITFGKSSRLNLILASAILVLYSQLWYMPHCCDSFPYRTNYKNMDALVCVKPYWYVAKKLFRKVLI